jgi:hypothetical protein
MVALPAYAENTTDPFRVMTRTARYRPELANLSAACMAAGSLLTL